MGKVIGFGVATALTMAAIGFWVKSTVHATNATSDTTVRMSPHEIMKGNTRDLPIQVIEDLF